VESSPSLFHTNSSYCDSKQRLEDAKDRVRSEYESYPATLANVLAEGPCYRSCLTNASAKRRLVVHVIGASVDSEFWGTSRALGDNGVEEFGVSGEASSSSAFRAYAEALSDLADSNQIDTIELVFVGPECPHKNIELSMTLQSGTSNGGSGGDLLIRSFKGRYNTELLEVYSLGKPDIVVFFNPGFTVPDYDWTDALAVIHRGTPFLSTTNTELEGIADCQYLLDQDRIQTMPAGLADIFGLYCNDDDDEEEGDCPPINSSSSSSNAFFSVNPFCGSRVRQSGTMANDLYVKNRWILGGIMDSFDSSKTPTAKDSMPSKKPRIFAPSQNSSDIGTSNSKRGNPALV